MRKFRYSFLLAILVLASCTPKDLLPLTKRNSLDSLLQKANVTGLQLVYFEGDHKVGHEYGFRDLQDSTLVTPNTIFQAASLSKQVTALLTLRLAEEGHLDLDQFAAEVYEEPRLANEPFYAQVTIKHLLAHTSGLPNWGGDLLQVDFEPGTNWQYSGEGYVLLSQLLSSVMDTPFEQLAEEWVFTPLGMTNTSFVWEDRFDADAAIGHNTIQQPGQKEQFTEANAAASLLTTASDYAKLLRGLAKRDFLSPESRVLFTDEFADASAWEAGDLNEYIAWSLGAGIQKNESETALWQWGDNFLFRGMMIYYPDSDRGLVYLTNSENGLSVASSLISYFFNEPSWAVDWLGYEPHDNPERLASIELEMAFIHEDSATAFATYNRVLDEQPDVLTENLINNMVWSLFAEKRLNAALRLIDYHLTNFPNSAEAFVRKGEALAFAHDYSASWEAYQKAMELDPNTSRVIMPRFPWYQEAWGALQSGEEPLALTAYTGQYGEMTIVEREGVLTFSDSQHQAVPLVRLSNNLFDLDNLATFRLRFTVSGNEVTEVTQSHLTGAEESAEKNGV